MTGRLAVREIGAEDCAAALEDLAWVLDACVRDGASVGFVAPFGRAEARDFWRARVFAGVESGARVLWGSYDGDRLVGTVQLALDMMPNQAHRGEVSKMLVHPGYRRQGRGRALLDALLARAGDAGRWLVTLDTRTGDPSQALYAAMGFQVAGEIPGFARAPDNSPRFDPTSYMYRIAGGAGRPLP